MLNIKKKNSITISFAILFLFVFISGVFFTKIYISDKRLQCNSNLVFKDRYGKILRFIPNRKGERHIWIPLDKIPNTVKHAFISAEDEKFYEHSGFDLKAVIRALKDNIKSRKIVSGASTITQQVVKIIKPRKRTYLGKFLEICSSILLEIKLSKEKILEQYLNRVPLGNNIRGVQLASLLYFGKSCGDLNVSESALLASLPKAPGHLDPYCGNKEDLLKRKNWVLNRMNKLGYLNDNEYKKALTVNVSFKQYEFPMEVSHFVDFLFNKRDSYFWIEGLIFGRVPVKIDLKLSTVDAPNAISVLFDVLRAMKIALKKKMKGPILPICTYAFKRPPRSIISESAEKIFNEFIKEYS